MWKAYHTATQHPKYQILNGGGILIYILASIYSFKDGVKYIGPSSTLYFFLLNFIGLIIAYDLFKTYPILSDNRPIGKFMKLIGQRTLDIYFLHYFFIPRNLQQIGDWFTSNPNPYLEYITAIIIAIIVILAALALGSILRLSPLLAQWLFASRQKA